MIESWDHDSETFTDVLKLFTKYPIFVVFKSTISKVTIVSWEVSSEPPDNGRYIEGFN